MESLVPLLVIGNGTADGAYANRKPITALLAWALFILAALLRVRLGLFDSKHWQRRRIPFDNKDAYPQGCCKSAFPRFKKQYSST